MLDTVHAMESREASGAKALEVTAGLEAAKLGGLPRSSARDAPRP